MKKREKKGRGVKKEKALEAVEYKVSDEARRDTHLVSSLHAVELVRLVAGLGLGLIGVELRVRDARSLSCLVDEDDLRQVQVRDAEESQAWCFPKVRVERDELGLHVEKKVMLYENSSTHRRSRSRLGRGC